MLTATWDWSKGQVNQERRSQMRPHHSERSDRRYSPGHSERSEGEELRDGYRKPHPVLGSGSQRAKQGRGIAGIVSLGGVEIVRANRHSERSKGEELRERDVRNAVDLANRLRGEGEVSA